MLSDDMELMRICASNYRVPGVAVEAWQRIKKILEEGQKPPTNNRSTKSPRNCCSCPVELDDLDGCDLQYGSGKCKSRVAREHRVVR